MSQVVNQDRRFSIIQLYQKDILLNQLNQAVKGSPPCVCVRMCVCKYPFYLVQLVQLVQC